MTVELCQTRARRQAKGATQEITELLADLAWRDDDMLVDKLKQRIDDLRGGRRAADGTWTTMPFNINEGGRGGWTLLATAAAIPHLGAVYYLLETEGAEVNIGTTDGRTPLYVAVEEGAAADQITALAVVQLLVTHGANVNIIPGYRARHDESVLAVASKAGYDELVSYLTGKGAIDNRTMSVNKRSRLAEMYARPNDLGAPVAKRRRDDDDSEVSDQ